MYLLDTNIASEVRKHKHGSVVAWLESVSISKSKPTAIFGKVAA
jgi:predicted nucleic acid-binding protein